jgi:hypothetical protein
MTGLYYWNTDEEEFYSVVTNFARNALIANREGKELARPPFMVHPTTDVFIYGHLWKMWDKGQLKIDVTFMDDESVDFYLPKPASTESLQRLVTREV